jgi:hypothetical protein
MKFIRVNFAYDVIGIYITPLIGYSNERGDKSFWIGWWRWLWVFRLCRPKDA